MCGIGGLIGGSPGDHLHVASCLRRALDHRGPDDAGHWHAPGEASAAVTLVHTRLAIQDLSPAGHPSASSGWSSRPSVIAFTPAPTRRCCCSS